MRSHPFQKGDPARRTLRLVARMLRRLYGSAATQIAETGAFALDTEVVSTALRSLYQTHFLLAARDTFLAVRPQKADIPDESADYWRRQLDIYVERALRQKVALIEESTRRDVYRIMREAQEEGVNREVISRRLEGQIEGMVKKRAKVIAATEQTASQNAGAYFGALQAGATKKRWWTFKDERVRDSHKDMHRVETAIDEPFQTADGMLMYPGDVQFGPNPRGVINCRCDVLYR